MTEETSNEVEQEVKEPTLEPSTNEAPVAAPSTFEIPTEAQDFVGEGKKYKSPEDALKSVPHAQEHISTLEAELAEVKEELTRRKTAQELLDEIKSGTQQEATASEVNHDDIEQLINSTIENRENAKNAKSNASSVADKFTAQYGAEAQTAYNQIAKEAGLTVQQLNNLAATSPNAVLKLSGLSGQVATPSSSSGTINTQSLNASPEETSSARVPRGASTKDLVKAWAAAGKKVKSQT
jgi:hypothetical protein